MKVTLSESEVIRILFCAATATGASTIAPPKSEIPAYFLAFAACMRDEILKTTGHIPRRHRPST
jgi:hypothetical protein